jgi:hypothetical protein
LFKRVWDGLSQGFTDLVNGLTKILGGVGTGANVAELIKLFGDGWKFIQQGVTWLNDEIQKVIDQIQELLDGIAKIWGLSGVNPIQDAIDAIAGIFGVANEARTGAEHANTQIEQIKATAAGGGGDEFDYPLAPNLDPPWIATGSGTGTTTWGPDGNGIVRAKLQANTALVFREMHYRRSDVNLLKSDCTVTVVLSNPPGDAGLAYAVFWIEAQKNATNQECVRVKVGPTKAQFELVSASGSVTKLGPEIRVPRAAAGDVYAFKIAGNVLSLHRNAITAGTYTGFTPLSGRQVGFGATQPIYVWIKGHPCPEFAGVTWA